MFVAKKGKPFSSLFIPSMWFTSIPVDLKNWREKKKETDRQTDRCRQGDIQTETDGETDRQRQTVMENVCECY